MASLLLSKIQAHLLSILSLSSLSSQTVQYCNICTNQLFVCSLKISEMRKPYAVLSQKSNSGRHTAKKNLNHFLINGPFLPSHRNLTSFCRFFIKCFCHMQLLFSGLGMNCLEWQSHKNQLTCVFNAMVIGKIKAHIQTLSLKNISWWNFPREGKKLKILQQMIQMMSLLKFTSEMFLKPMTQRTKTSTSAVMEKKINCRKPILNIWNWNGLIFFSCSGWNCTLIENHFKISDTERT